VFDRDGHYLGYLGKRPRRGFSLTEDDWEEVHFSNSAERFKMRLSKKSNHNIHVLERYVLVFLFPNLFELYDYEGNLIRDSLSARNMMEIIDASGDRIVCTFPVFEDPSRYELHDLEAMDAAGVTKEKLDESNPFLRISRLVEPLR
jgi:hypothetical protein